MNKNIKKILLFSIFIIILIGISGVNAQEVSNDTISSDLSDNVQVSTDTVYNTDLNSNINNNDNIEKITTKQKNIKTDDSSIDITNENYDQLGTYMNQYSTLNFVDDFDGKTIDITNGVTITSSPDYTFTNSHFTVNANGVTINNLNIVNTDNSDSSAIFVNAKNNVNINNNHITVTKTTSGTTYAIELNGTSNSVINSNTIVVNAYPQAKQWINTSATNYIGIVKVSGIVVDDSDYVDVTYNDITVTNSTETGYSTSTFEGITIRNESTYVSARNNDIDVSNANYTYGITIEKSDRCNATYNTIALSSENYVCGIEVMEDKHTLLSHNTITGTAYKYQNTNLVGESFAYGIYLSANYITDMTQNVTVSYNTINLASNIVYGIEGYKISTTSALTRNYINFNTITVTGNVSMGMGFDTTYRTYVQNNIIVVNGYNKTLGYYYEEITPITTGIELEDSTLSLENQITNNHILVTEHNAVVDVIYAIVLKSATTAQNNYITSNYPTNQQLTGNNAVYKAGIIGYSVSGNVAYDLTNNNNLLINKAKSNIKSDSKTIILNTSNFAEYVTNRQFNENVAEGDVIDIQGELIGSQYAITLNKAVNVTSTTNNAFLNFDDQSFVISSTASGSNITGLTLRDTSMNIEASNIFLNNNTISVSDEEYAINLAEGITDITISNNAIASLNGRENNAINSNSVTYSSENNTNTPLYFVITDSNYGVYIPDGMTMARFIINGDYLSFNVTSLLSVYLCYDDFTSPNITIYNTTSYVATLILGTNSVTIENSIINVAPYMSTTESVLKLVNSTVIQVPPELVGVESPFTLDMDENSLFIKQNNSVGIYGGWITMGQVAGGKAFENTATTVYVLFYLDQYLPDVIQEIESTNGRPIVTKTTNITGIIGKIWLETLFEEGSDDSIITNVFFNESVNVTSPINNVKFINCTFNKGILVANGSNITFEGCTGDITYYEYVPLPPKTIVLTSENYNEYVTNRTFNDNVRKGDTIDMQGLFDSSLKGLTVNKAVNIISSTNDANISLDSGLDTRRTGNQFIITSRASGTNITGISFYNTRVTVDGAYDVSINNITYTNYMEQIGSNVGGFSIRNGASNVNVTNSTFFTHGNFGHSTLVVAGANNVLLENNTVIGETDDVNVLGKIGNLVYITTYGTDGENYNITVRGNYIDGSKILRDNEIANTFRIQGENITVENNTILATDYAILEQWVQGVDVLLKNLIIKDNNLTGAVNLASQNVTMINNKLDSTTITNSTLINNTIESLNLGHDSVLSGNTISNSIKLDENITIENNVINAEVNINTSNIICNNVTFNDKVVLNSTASNITFTDCTFNKGLYVTGTNITIDNCTGNIVYLDAALKVDTTEFVAGSTANIIAGIYFDDKLTNINKGKITFKVNGKTLKDASGKVIYAKVVNGTATIENYEIPSSWNNDTTIEAVYSGSIQCDSLRSEKTNMTITPKALTLETSDITATIGSNITLKATLSDNTINTGKMLFKINGKTVKDANGKVIYVKVVNGTASVDYLLDGYKTGTYTITCIYTSSVYDRMQQNATLTITKA